MFHMLLLFHVFLVVIQDHFILIVSEFIYIPWKYAREQTAIRASMRDGNLCTPSISGGAAESFESHMTEYLREQVRNGILLLKLV